MTSQLTYGELCSGVGGLSMAIEEIFDATPAFHCEYDDAPRKVLEARWPDVPLYRDVKALNWEEMPRVDVMGGGYPCQPFSLSGKRQGKDDERHLWPYIAEGVSALEPSYVYFENVYGHLSKGLSDVVIDLNRLGYEVAWGVQKASDVGAPHERKRVFIMGKRLMSGAASLGYFRDNPVIAIQRGDKLPPSGVARHGEYVVTDPLEAMFAKGVGLPTPLANSHTGAGHQGRAGGKNLQTIVSEMKAVGGGNAPTNTNSSGRREQRRAVTVPAQHATAQHESDGAGQMKLFLTPCAAEGVKGTPQLSRMKARNGQVWLSNNVIDIAEVNAIATV